MPKKEAPLQTLANFIPEQSVQLILPLLNKYSVHLTVTRARKSILGDYRHATSHNTHRISVNGNLNAYAFLITLIHELAHLITFLEFGNRVLPHGREWKSTYAKLLLVFLDQPVFPPELEQKLRQSLHNLPASSCADENLTRMLALYDKTPDWLKHVEQIEEGANFIIEGGRMFKRGKKLRKRYQCTEITTGKIYLFSPVYSVKAVNSL